MDFKQFLLDQKEEILKYKWCQGVKLGHDPGDAAVVEWVEKNAARFREEYQKEYEALIHKTADTCKKDLKQKLPGVSDELWDYVFTKIIAEFTKLWLKELCMTSDPVKEKHLTEI